MRKELHVILDGLTRRAASQTLFGQPTRDQSIRQRQQSQQSVDGDACTHEMRDKPVSVKRPGCSSQLCIRHAMLSNRWAALIDKFVAGTAPRSSL